MEKTIKYKNTTYSYIYEADKNVKKPVIEKKTHDISTTPEGYGSFFTVNGFESGIRKKDCLTDINGVYVDIDHVDKSAQDLLMEMSEKLLPTVINQTKNGFHCIWLLEKPITIYDNNRDEMTQLVEGINQTLITLYNGDEKAKDVTRLLRVPNTLHLKDPDNPFTIKTVHESLDNVYTMEEIKEAYPPSELSEKYSEIRRVKISGYEVADIVKDYSDLDIKSGDRHGTLLDIAKSIHKQLYSKKTPEECISIVYEVLITLRDNGMFENGEEKTDREIEDIVNYTFGYRDRFEKKVAKVEKVLEETGEFPKGLDLFTKNYFLERKKKSLDMDTLLYTIVGKDKVKKYSCNLYNAMKIIEHYNICKYDEFKCRHFIKEDGEWVSRTDDVDLRLYEKLTKEYPFMANMGATVLRSAISKVAMDNKYDSAKEYCESLEWDGESRIDHWLHKVFKVEDDDYYTDIGSNWLKGMVDRMVNPACKFDGALIIKGGQNMGKSRVFLALSEGFADGINSVEFTDGRYRQLVEDMQGKLIVEFSEGAVFSKADQKDVKSIITKQYDRMRIPYEAHSRDFPRRCVFAVTTNEDSFLKDDTGNRRWWPVECEDDQHLLPEERVKADQKWLLENREQLFAEAYHRVINLKETTYEINHTELELRQIPFEDRDTNEDLYMSVYNSLSESVKQTGVTTRLIYEKAFPKTDISGDKINANIDKSTEMAITRVLKNPKKLNLEKNRRKDTTYWVPRNPLKDFQIDVMSQKEIDEVKKETTIDEDITNQANYWED